MGAKHQVKDHVTESDLINYLIDTMTDRLDVTKEGKLVIRED
ncbi:hypothetical protein [Cellvibrio mixtus]|nr:hypothetical protein [Cellvibrio mixtus]